MQEIEKLQAPPPAQGLQPATLSYRMSPLSWAKGKITKGKTVENMRKLQV